MDVTAFFGADPSRDEDTCRFARMSPEERLELFMQLCDLTDSVQRGRPNRESLRAPHPLSDESLALWRRLMRQKS